MSLTFFVFRSIIIEKETTLVNKYLDHAAQRFFNVKMS